MSFSSGHLYINMYYDIEVSDDRQVVVNFGIEHKYDMVCVRIVILLCASELFSL